MLVTSLAQAAAPIFVTREVIPSATDPQITTTNYNQPHIVVLVTNVPPPGKLLLHLPGTSSHPEGAQDWLRTAATHGYHAIGLKYQNDVSMGSLCTVNTNLDCYEDVTDETVTGLFYPDTMPDAPKQVLRADSIENHVQKLLVGLAALAPASENWGQVPQRHRRRPLEPPPARATNITTWSATGNNRSKVAYEDIRPDHNWPTNLVLNGWSLTDAQRFPYLALSETGVIDQRLPKWIRTAYPHTISPDPTRPDGFVRVDSGTMSVEFWRSGPLNRTNEVIFATLSDGGHQWPNSNDQLPFDANIEVLEFFEAHPLP